MSVLFALSASQTSSVILDGSCFGGIERNQWARLRTCSSNGCPLKFTGRSAAGLVWVDPPALIIWIKEVTKRSEFARPNSAGCDLDFV